MNKTAIMILLSNLHVDQSYKNSTSFISFSTLGFCNFSHFSRSCLVLLLMLVYSLFGIIFSINLTPCTGAFLGSALMMASTSKTAIEGMFLLLTYSLGLGLPLIFSAVLIEKLNTTFGFIKKHYKIINTISGIFLIVIGVLITFGIMNSLLYNFM